MGGNPLILAEVVHQPAPPSLRAPAHGDAAPIPQGADRRTLPHGAGAAFAAAAACGVLALAVVATLLLPALSFLLAVACVGALTAARRARRALAEREAAFAASEAKVQRLDEMNRSKVRFLSHAAHELRNPLTPIKLQLHLLERPSLGALNDRQRRALLIAQRNMERLDVLIEDLLDIGRLQGGHLRPARVPLDLEGVITDVAESFAAQAGDAKVGLTIEAAPGLRVDADANRMAQVLFNLLGNAIKYTPSSGQVSVLAAREGEEVVVRVRDSGIGIAPDDIARLFQPFEQLEAPVQPSRAGAGLGLYICRSILEHQGGRIWCESKGRGEGSTFAFALPCVDVAQPGLPPAS